MPGTQFFVPPEVAQSISSIVTYNWTDEERDYNTEALKPGNSRDGHIFGDLMLVQRWLEFSFSYRHIEPRIVQAPRCAQCTRRTDPDGRHLPEDGGEFACPKTTQEN